MTIKDEVEILLVEDNPTDAELTLRALRKNKLANQVVVVSDGEQALDFIFARGAYSDRKLEPSPKVILLDLKLPKIDGLEVLKVLKGDPRAKVIPTVILTSSKEERDLLECYQLGANSYIVKPVDFEKFQAAIQSLGSYWLLFNHLPQR